MPNRPDYLKNISNQLFSKRLGGYKPTSKIHRDEHVPYKVGVLFLLLESDERRSTLGRTTSLTGLGGNVIVH